jgi:hypothetical protein
MERKLQDLSDIELKALAYDTLAQLQLLQNNLNTINGELGRRSQQAQLAQQRLDQGFIPRDQFPVGTVETV